MDYEPIPRARARRRCRVPSGAFGPPGHPAPPFPLPLVPPWNEFATPQVLQLIVKKMMRDPPLLEDQGGHREAAGPAAGRHAAPAPAPDPAPVAAAAPAAGPDPGAGMADPATKLHFDFFAVFRRCIVHRILGGSASSFHASLLLLGHCGRYLNTCVTRASWVRRSVCRAPLVERNADDQDKYSSSAAVVQKATTFMPDVSVFFPWEAQGAGALGNLDDFGF